MAERQVEVIRHVAADPARVWAILGDFCGAWHPLIAEMHAEHDGRGALIRAFRARGDETLYREQLTYRSDTDRTLRYTHLEGIAGAERYDAEVMVKDAEGGGSTVEWRARIDAAAERADGIAAGTEAIFAMGIEALATATPAQESASPRQGQGTGQESIEDIILDGNPRLGLSVAGRNRQGPLILFLHGIGGGRRNWLPQLRAAARFGTAVAMDFRGYGDSAPGAANSTVEDYCADILRVAGHFGKDRLVLCGLSYGAWIATSFAMRHPERLAGLVLSGGCTGMSEAGAEERENFRRSREVPLNEGKTPADFAPAVVGILAGPDADEAVRAALLASMAAIPAAAYRDALTCFTHPPERFDFAKLTMPVLLMTGEFDRLASPQEIRGVARRICEAAPRASVRFEVIRRAGHVCNVERPDAYNEPLADFLAEVFR